MTEYVKGIITAVAWVCSSATTITAAVLLIVKPIRKKALANQAEENGVKCLLRSDMLRIYYRCLDARQIRQFEYQNFLLEYQAYKAMGGNSFIDHIKEEVEEWDVVST